MAINVIGVWVVRPEYFLFDGRRSFKQQLHTAGVFIRSVKLCERLNRNGGFWMLRP